MVDLGLDFDEGVILETEGVHRSGIAGDSYIKTMFLTNKNIIYVTSQKTGGIFSKSVDVVDKVPLSAVKIINGQVLVSQKKTDLFEYALQIQFVGGTAEYSYNEGSKKITNQWIKEINKLLGNDQIVKNQEAPKKEDFLGGLSRFASGVGTVGQSITSSAKQAADQVSISYEKARANTEAKRQGQAQQEKLPLVPTAASANYSTRQQQFAGTILKCPNCGTVISQTTAICPECGYHITGQAAVSSVQAFCDKLMLLESRRKGAGLGQMLGLINPVDNQKLSLIRSFPIPNTIDDIQEFMLLAIANIDVALSKNTWNNRHQSKAKRGESGLSMPKTISDAWVEKMKQAYQKAIISFANDPAFAYVQRLFLDKMTELKIRID